MSDGDFVAVRAVIPDDAEEALMEVLARHHALGAHLDTAGNALEAVVYFAGGQRQTASDFIADLRSLTPRAPCLEILQAQDWLAPYRRQCRPFPVGATWWIDPDPDRLSEVPEGRRRLVLEPRLAFGSGSHETTRLLLEQLEHLDLAGRAVLDLGTGSGVLALAALQRGAGWALGVDIDPTAVFVAATCARDQSPPRNPVLAASTTAALRLLPTFDLVLCNMIPEHFLPQAGDIAKLLAPGGLALFSGVLNRDRTEVLSALGDHGLSCRVVQRDGEWIALEGLAHGP